MIALSRGLVLGAFAVAGASVAAAQQPDVTLNDLSYTTGPVTYRVPALVVRGARASREELVRLADPATAGSAQAKPLEERLRAFEADEIAIPELTVETGPADARVTLTARDIRASGIKDGRVASITAGGSEIAAKVPGGVAGKVLRGGIGRVAIQDLDLALAASLPEPGTGEALRALYGSVSLEALRLTEPGGVTLRLDRFASRDVRARRTEAGWRGAVAALSSDAGAVPTERLLAILADCFASLRLGSFEAGGLGFELAGPDRQAARIGRIDFAEGTPALNLEDVEVGGRDGRLTIGRATLGGVPADGGTAAALSGGDALRRLLPGSGSVRLDSVALAGPDRNAVTIGTVDLGVTRSAAAAAPTAFSFAARDIAMPSRPQDPALKPLVDLGYAGLAGSIEGTATYDGSREELSIAGLKLRVDDVGEVGIGARLTQVSPDLFQRDTTRAATALLGMRARSLDVTIANGGLAERLVDRQARLTGAKPDDIRRQYAGAAGFGVLMALGPDPGVQTLGTALSRFVTKPGRLGVTLTAKDAAGLRIADLVMGPDPRKILDQLEIAASAE